MLKALKWFFGLFSPYVNSFERKVDRFFKNVKSTDSLASIKNELLALMKENLIVTNVWMEKKYKGYKYLTKSVRAKMYVNIQHIVEALEEHSKTYNPSVSELKSEFAEMGIGFPTGDEEKVKYLAQIMSFLKPGKHYHYIKTASFGKLLIDPSREKLEGDCNQIVTLYIYLYALKFPIEDLQIKLLPEHVCLHFRELDIEATNGTFQKYKDGSQVLPVTEIISTNMLDLTDFREEVQQIDPRVFVKSAQLAYAISSLKSLVMKNLDVAYHNLALSALKSNDFETAIFYFSKTSDKTHLNNVYQNAAIYYMGQNNFTKAGFYAQKYGDAKLIKSIKRNEGIYYYNNNKIDRALTIFKNIGDLEMEKACYQKQYNGLVKKVAADKTLAAAKLHRGVYQKMLDLAQKMEDEVLATSVSDTLKRI